MAGSTYTCKESKFFICNEWVFEQIKKVFEKYWLLHIIISYPDAGLGHCPEGQGPDIKHKFW